MRIMRTVILLTHKLSNGVCSASTWMLSYFYRKSTTIFKAAGLWTNVVTTIEIRKSLLRINQSRTFRGWRVFKIPLRKNGKCESTVLGVLGA